MEFCDLPPPCLRERGCSGVWKVTTVSHLRPKTVYDVPRREACSPMVLCDFASPHGPGGHSKKPRAGP